MKVILAGLGERTMGSGGMSRHAGIRVCRVNPRFRTAGSGNSLCQFQIFPVMQVTIHEIAGNYPFVLLD